MKKLLFTAMLLSSTMPSFGAAKSHLNFVLGEKIALSLQKILDVYTPQSMLDHPIIDAIVKAKEVATKGQADLAIRRISHIVKTHAARLENYPRSNSISSSLITMLNNAKKGEDPY